MLIVMERTANPEQVSRVCDEIKKMGMTPHPMAGEDRTAIGVTGNNGRTDSDRLKVLAGVREVIHVTKPYKLADREYHPEDTLVRVGDITIGGPEFMVMAGPCSVESRDQCFAIAERVAKAGARVFRGGAFKPRTSPYSFQGLGHEGLSILAQVKEQFNLLIVTEAVDTDTVDQVADCADILQVGARNMQNYSLLKKVGRTRKPVLLKRGMSATLQELLMAAEYVLAEGNERVILCERGVRTFAEHTRNTLDLSAVPYVKRHSHLPIIADPSHGTGRRDQVLPLSRAAIAVGADGLLVEVHHEPGRALSDGFQAITPDVFDQLMDEMRRLAPVLNRTIV